MIAHKLIDEEGEERKPRSRIFLVLLWIAMLLIAFVFIFALLNFLGGIFPTRLVSLDWGGYIAFSPNQQPLISGVSGSWTVPRVEPTSEDSSSAMWIGVGGYVDSDNTLIQAGTEQDSVNGAAIYSAWYETLPGSSIGISTLSIHPGDRVSVSIMLVNSGAHTWSIIVSDTTTGQKFQNSLTYSSSRLSAEWIVERPTINGGLSPLTNFGSVTFSNSMAINNATSESINKFSYARITMIDQQNTQLVSISSLSSDGESFTVNYLISGSTTAILKNYFDNTIAVQSDQAVRKALA